MYFALDGNGNRVRATDQGIQGPFRCPVCDGMVERKQGSIRQWHFAHLRKSACPYGKDKDYDHEWHIRMQEYFPVENREIIFKDKETGEKHIADVFLPETNIVLEFQHSPIKDEEFLSRTDFHLKEGRRIVWLFDESETNPNPDHLGRFQQASFNNQTEGPEGLFPYYFSFYNNPYQYLYFKWLRNPRRVLAQVEPFEISSERFVVCVYTGLEGDCYHRLQHKTCTEKTMHVTFSLHNIMMKENMDAEEFFDSERKWQEQPQFMNAFNPFYVYVGRIESKKSLEAYKKAEIDRINCNQGKSTVPRVYRRNHRRF